MLRAHILKDRHVIFAGYKGTLPLPFDLWRKLTPRPHSSPSPLRNHPTPNSNRRRDLTERSTGQHLQIPHFRFRDLEQGVHEGIWVAQDGCWWWWCCWVRGFAEGAWREGMEFWGSYCMVYGRFGGSIWRTKRGCSSAFASGMRDIWLHYLVLLDSASEAMCLLNLSWKILRNVFRNVGVSLFPTKGQMLFHLVWHKCQRTPHSKDMESKFDKPQTLHFFRQFGLGHLRRTYIIVTILHSIFLLSTSRLLS